MAKAPTKKQVVKLLFQSQDEIDKKTAKQELQHKGFVPTSAGVIPEKTWQKLPGKEVV